jgi:hypothetical protein
MVRDGFESNQIWMESDPNIIFYYILIRIQIQMQILSNMNTKQIVQIQI